MLTEGPYALGAPAYIAAGWSGILPLPPGTKTPPPTGYTGDAGTWPSAAQIATWRTQHPDGNIALRMPLDVIGLDLDAYKDPEVRARLEALLGPLPPTWCSTSRPGTDSGIRFYRVPVLGSGEGWRGAPIPACEVIQYRHRYAVVAPSVHPEGRPYLWVDERSGEQRLLDPPEIDDLTELPWRAIAALKIAKAAAEQRPFAEVALTGGAMSTAVDRRLSLAIRDVQGAAGGRHDAACAAVAALVRLAERGEPGVDTALEHLGATFAAAVSGGRPGGHPAAVAEYAAIVDGARKLIGATVGRIPTKAERELEQSGRWQMHLLGLTVNGQIPPSPTDPTAPTPDPDGGAHVGDPALTAAFDGVVELDDLLAGDDEPFDWLIPGLIERGDRVILTGLEGRGKSTLLRQFAVRVASGLHPFDPDADIEARRVLYVDLENSRRQTRRKIRDLRRTAGRRYQQMLEFAFRPEGIDLTRNTDVLWLTTVVFNHRPDLVIIGPIYKMSNGDPKDEQDAKAVASVLDQLRTAYGFAMLIEAHTPYSEGGKSKRPERPYGASLWSRWPEFGMFLGPDGDLLHWRGQRDEREWPLKVRRGETWPWEIDKAWNANVGAANPDTEDGGHDRKWEGPTRAMAAVEAHLNRQPEIEFTETQLVEILPKLGARFRKDVLRAAIAQLALDGRIEMRAGARKGWKIYRAKRHESTPQVDLFAQPAPTGPNRPQPAPGPLEGGPTNRPQPAPTPPYGGVGGGAGWLAPSTDPNHVPESINPPRSPIEDLLT